MSFPNTCARISLFMFLIRFMISLGVNKPSRKSRYFDGDFLFFPWLGLTLAWNSSLWIYLGAQKELSFLIRKLKTILRSWLLLSSQISFNRLSINRDLTGERRYFLIRHLGHWCTYDVNMCLHVFLQRARWSGACWPSLRLAVLWLWAVDCRCSSSFLASTPSCKPRFSFQVPLDQ